MGRRERMVRVVGAVLAMGVTLLTSLPLQAQTSLFGPQQYTRTAGPPNQFTDTFTLPAGATPPYTLRIVNGNANGTNRISSARVTLNGTEIAGPNDFGQNVAVIDRTVSLQASNTLHIRLTSAPGSFINISLLDTGAGAQPTALTPSPLNLTAGSTGTLTATLAPAPTSAGSLTVSSADTAVATVPASVSFGVGQTSVPIPVTAVAAGSTTITVMLNGGSAASQITVTPPLPTLTAFTPTSGQPGTPVTITGTHFVNVQQVMFNNVTATFTVTDATTLVAIVPPGGTTGPIAIQTLAGTAGSATNFTVIPAPTLASLQPATLTLVQGDQGVLTVTLDTVSATDMTVTLGSNTPTVATVPNTVRVPAQQLSAPITITAVAIGQADITASLNGTSASSTVTVVNPVPVLSSLTPTSAPSGSPNTTLSLTGQQFVSGATVQFGATALATTFVTATQLSAVIPAAALTSQGTVPVTVTNPAPGGGLSNSLPFTIVNGPPQLNPIGNQTVPLGSTLSFTVTATDPDQDPVTVAVVNAAPAPSLPLPAHATFNSQTGVFTFIPDATQVGTVSLVFSASDGVQVTTVPVTITVTGVIADAPTSLSGRVDDSSGNPIAGLTVTLRDASVTATTNAQGQFTLTFSDHPAGRRHLLVTGVPQGYANLVAPVELIAHTANVLPSPVTTPPLDLSTAVTVNPAATTVLTSPSTGVTVTIPPGRAKNADGTAYTGQLTISPVPEYGRPESRPVELRPGLAVTIQPAGIVLDPPVPITFPNIDNLLPGSELDLWSLSPDTGTFFQVGAMRVSADGQRVETVSGGVRKTAWHYPLPPNPLPNTDNAQQAGPCTQCAVASQGDLTEGALTQEVIVPGIRTLGQSRDLTLRYTSTTADVRPILPINAFLSVRAAVPPTFSARLTVGGVQQGPEVYWDSHAVAENDNSTSRLGVPFDASAFATGHYPYELTLFSNYPQSSIGGVGTSRVLLRNERQSAFGVGWTLSGLDRLVPQPNGSVVLAKGTGETSLFSFLAPVNPVSWWPGEGTAQDVVGGNNGVLQGATTFSVGQIGQAFTLDGLSSVVQVPHSSALDPGTGSFTIDAWVQTTNAVGAQTVVSKYECGQTCPSAATSLYFLYVNAGKIAGQLRSSGSPGGASGSSGQFLQGTQYEVADGALHHLAMVRDMAAQEMRLYVDGRLDTSAPLILEAQGAIKDDDGEADPLVIGAVLVGGTTNKTNFFTGRIDDVDFFNRALSANEIQQLYEVGKVGAAKLLPGASAQWLAPPGDFSRLMRNVDNTYTRTLKDGTVFQFNAQGLQTSQRDRNGNQTTYGYDGSGQFTTITDPAGLLTTLGYSGSRLATITDPQGRITQFTHDGGGNLTQVRYADTSTQAFAYDAQYRLVQKTDARSQVSQYTYDYAGRLSQATLPYGSIRALVPSQRMAVPNLAAGQGTASTPATLSTSTTNQASFTDAKNQTTRFETDALGRITKQTDALNRVATIQRDAQGNLTQITRSNGAFTTMTYDAKGNLLTSTEQAIAATTNFTYEPTFNQVTSIRDPKGNLTQIAYDAKGNPLTITDADNKLTTFTYDGRGLLLTSKDALNQTTTFTYDALGRLLTTTDPLNRTTTLTYDAAGNVATSTDALNRITSFEYDAKNRLKNVIDPNTGVTSYTYDGNGNLLTVTDAKNQVTTFAYDAGNRLLSTTDPLSKVETYEYDGNDNLIKRRTPKGEDILFAYDAVNQLLSKTLPGSQVTSYLYDQVGNLTNVTDPDSVLAMTYDQANRLTTVKTDGSPNQPAVSLGYGYDPNGNRLILTEGAKTTSYHYDGLNRLIGLGDGVTLPPPAANLTAWWRGEGTGADAQGAHPGTLRNGVAFAAGFAGQAFSFDGVDDEIGFTSAVGRFGWQATIDFWIKTTSTRRETIMSDRLSCNLPSPPTAAAAYWELQLQTNGRVTMHLVGPDPSNGSTWVVNPTGTTGVVNDGQWHRIGVVRNGSEARLYRDGQMEGYWNNIDGGPVLSGLPAGGLRIGTGVCGASPFTGQLDEISIADRAWTQAELQAPRTQEQPVAAWSYDGLSRRTSLTLPNGIQTTYQYDPASQVTNIVHQMVSSATQINQAAYAYNQVGNRTSLTDRRGSQAFGYDNLDRLASATHPLPPTSQTFAYDPVGNRTTGGSVVNAGNQLTEDAQFIFEHDANGNQTKKTSKATNNFTVYTYDAENRLTKAEEFAAGNPTAIATSTYRYDGLGRRIEKVANGQTKRYIYDGEDILLEYDGTNTLQARYTHGPGIDEPIAVTKGSSTFFYHQDGLGTVTDLTDSAGATAKSYAYDAYGTILESLGTVEQPYTYTGRELDNETGLYYYRVRYYDSTTGRFLQKDPLGVSGGSVNLYGYVSNNVPNRIDPFGLIDTVSEAIKRAAARGDVGELEALLEATGNQAAKSAIERLRARATEIIAKECKGSINREFPEQLRQKTLEEIFELAKKGDEAARTAKKLLSDLRFKK